MTTDLNFAHRQMMAAIKAISQGSQLDDFVSLPSDYGRPFRIREGLIRGKEFPEPFHDEQWPMVEAAFARLKLDPPSRMKDECCAALLRA